MIEKLPSQHELIPNLGVLDRLIMESCSGDEYSKTQRLTEQLPYYLRATCFSLNELEHYRIQTIKAWSEIPEVGSDTQFVLPPELFDPLSFAADSYLFFLRRVMDSLITYISRCPSRQSLPSSMKDLMKGVETSKYGLDNGVISILNEYWGSIGKKVKGYRDQVAHSAVILSNCVVFNTPEGYGLKMLLPDNPEERSPSKIGYSPGIGTMGFFFDALKQTIQLVNQIVERLIDLMGAHENNPREKGIVGLTMRGGTLQLNSIKSGEPVPYPIGVMRVLSMAFDEKSR